MDMNYMNYNFFLVSGASILCLQLVASSTIQQKSIYRGNIWPEN